MTAGIACKALHYHRVLDEFNVDLTVSWPELMENLLAYCFYSQRQPGGLGAR